MSRKLTEGEAILSRQRRRETHHDWYIFNKERIRANRSGANQCNSIWTPERHRELVALFEQKLPTSEIGRRMGLTKNTVIGRLNRCGLRRRGEYAGPTSMERLKAINAAWAARNGAKDEIIGGVILDLRVVN